MKKSYPGQKYSSTHISNLADRLMSLTDRPLKLEDAPLVQEIFSQVMIFGKDYDESTRSLVYDLVAEFSRVHYNDSIGMALADALDDTSETPHIHEIVCYALTGRPTPVNHRRVTRLKARTTLGKYFPYNKSID